MKCENCNKEHEGNYGSGRFCSVRCAKSFSTKNKRKEINKKVSTTMKGREAKNKKWPDKFCKICGRAIKRNGVYEYCKTHYSSSPEHREKMSKAMKNASKNGNLKGWITRNKISFPEKFFINVLKNNNLWKGCEHNYPINKSELGIKSKCNYFLDFFFKDKKIDLEIDGSQHKYRKAHDEVRDKLLQSKNIIVYRIKWRSIKSKKGKEYIKNEIDKFLQFYNNS